ncbi:MAG: hypothetical protein WC445_02525 [Patescibacteria group bacterium]
MLRSSEISDGKEKMELETLRYDFCEMFDIDKRESALELFGKIVEKYESEDRAYHNLEHIKNFLVFLEKFEQKIKDARGLKLAAWLHDVVYDTRAKDNEEQSAKYAEDYLKSLGVSGEITNHVIALIRATANHKLIGDDPDSEIFLDGDLAILGSSDDEYDSYAKKIRQEYAWVPDDQYREGRRKILENFLNTPRIYFTEEAGKELEQRARKNLKREIDSL